MQSISEHEAWKRVLEELPEAKFVCTAIRRAVPEHTLLYWRMKGKVMGHLSPWYRRHKALITSFHWPLTPRGNLCRRLFVERMIRETAV